MWRRGLALSWILLPALAAAQPPPLPFYQQVDWSPDGRHLAYCAVIESWETGYEMFVVEADGSDPRRLGAGIYPVFSPDGERLAFARDGDLFTMRTDGSDVVRLTEGPERDSSPPGHPTARAWRSPQPRPTPRAGG